MLEVNNYNNPYNINTNSLDLLSLPFPKFFNYNKNKVIINNGNIKDGVINNKILCDILDILFSINYDVVKFISHVHKIVSIINIRLCNHSVGITDIINNINIEDIYSNNYNIHDPTDEEISIITDNIMLDCKTKLLEQNINNSLWDMVNSNAKGSIDNIVSISLTLGHQMLSNKPIANGSCKSSYIKGLTSKEFFYHMMSSREGVVHTNVRVSDIGHAGRKICKIICNTTINNDNKIVENDDEEICDYIPDIKINSSIFNNLF